MTTSQATVSNARLQPRYEAQCQSTIVANPNMLVPWYLMASYAYYVYGKTIISDALYDQICQRLDAEWDSIEHRDKPIIECAFLKRCSGAYICDDNVPAQARGSLDYLLVGGDLVLEDL